MFRSGWLPVFALIGLALQPIGQGSYAQERGAKSETEPQQAPQVIAPLNLTPLYERLERIDRSIEALKASPESSDEHRRAESDLKAQQDMAQWAKWMTIVTGMSVVVSSIGVAAVVITLRQNAKSLRIAAMGAKRASQSIRLTKETAQRQLRAYLCTTSVGIRRLDGMPNTLTCTLEVFNSGQTPAYELISSLSFDFKAVGAAKKLPGCATVGAQTKTLINVHSPDIEQSDMKLVLTGQKKMRLWGRLDYKDAFGASKHVALVYKIQRVGDEWVISPESEGNHST